MRPDLFYMEEVMPPLRKPGWSLWLLWLLATIIGYALATFFTLTVIDSLLRPNQSSSPSGLSISAIFVVWAALTGLLIGFLQAMTLRLFVRDFSWGRYVLFTSGGMVVGALVI